jgi:hypothetical protein
MLTIFIPLAGWKGYEDEYNVELHKLYASPNEEGCD